MTGPACGLSPRVRGNRNGMTDEHNGFWSIPACAGEPPSERAAGAQGGVYPRVCGGTDDEDRSQQRFNGLSPRVRGNLRSAASEPIPEGSIPACAGEPTVHASASRALPVYPRVCGGTDSIKSTSTPSSGLSPRVRGNREGLPAIPPSPGSIPACAGEPYAMLHGLHRRPVYPRVCGGTKCGLVRQGRNSGLSPRVRGNREARIIRAARIGSIPACGDL